MASLLQYRSDCLVDGCFFIAFTERSNKRFEVLETDREY